MYTNVGVRVCVREYVVSIIKPKKFAVVVVVDVSITLYLMLMFSLFILMLTHIRLAYI